MNGERLVSLIISDMETSPLLPRLLQTVSRQHEGLDDVELVIVSPNSETYRRNALAAVANNDNISFESAPHDASASLATNLGIEQSRGSLLLLLRPDFRLDARFLSETITLFDEEPDAGVVYTDFTLMDTARNRAAKPGLVHLPEFSPERLRHRNIIGPAVMLRRSLWESNEGFRDNTLYSEWDFWVQAAQTGSIFGHIQTPLASCEAKKVSFRERAEDGRAKAMVVINNPGFFHEHTVRWAMAYMRGESWAVSFAFKTIPGAMDVSHMLHEHTLATTGADRLAEEAWRNFDKDLTASGRVM